jgi:DNA ligase-1
MRFAEVVDASAAVAATAGRLEKIARLAALLSRTPPDVIPIVVGFLIGEPRQGRVNVGMALLSTLRDLPPSADSSLTVNDVDDLFARLSAAAGAGAGRARAAMLRDTLGRATAVEQDFLIRLLFGELRQGALEGVLVDAVARAANVQAAVLRRAAMLAGEIGVVARVALTEGEAALAQFVLRPFQPVQPMLAASAGDVDAALADLGEASFEYKLDGARNSSAQGRR